MAKKKLYTITLSPEVASAGKAKALDELRSFSAFIERLIKQEVKK